MKTLTKEVRFCAYTQKLQKKKKTSCKSWHLPVCQNHNSQNGCKFGETCRVRHAEAEEKPSRRSKKCGAKGSGALLKEPTQLSCVSQEFLSKKNIFYVNKENWIKTRRQIVQRHLAPN